MVASVVVDRPKVRKPKLALVANRLVDEAVVAKKFVVVALVVVEFPRTMRWFAKVTTPLSSIAKMAVVEVANVDGEEVAK